MAISALFFASNGGAQENCPVAEVVSPPRGTTVSEPRPEIAWKALPGVSRYRVQLESRVPEGRMITRFDTFVATHRFVPPAVLTEERAAIKVLVTADCPGKLAPRVTEEAALFFIDLASRCPAPQEVQVSKDGALTWTRTPGAQRYQVAAYSAVDGRSLAQAETLQPGFQVSNVSGPAYAMLRARCASGYSAAVYRVFGSPNTR